MTALPVPGAGFPDLGFLGAVPYHVSFATRDLDQAMEAFGGLMALRWTPIADDVAPGLGPGDTTGWRCRRVVSLGGPLHVELSEGSPGSIWHTDQRAVLHHLAYWCDDLRASIEAMEAQGWHMELTLLDGAGQASEFAYLARPGWPRLEVVAAARAPAFLDLTGHTGAAGAAVATPAETSRRTGG